MTTIATHCTEAGGVLGPGELPVMNVSHDSMLTIQEPISGLRRGVVVMLHGLESKVVNGPFVDTGGFLPVQEATLVNALCADGWVVIKPRENGDNFSTGNQGDAYAADIGGDTAGHGSRFVGNVLHWWDHVELWIKATYGDWPIVPFGFSGGANHALWIAANRQASITAYCSVHPATTLSNVTGWSIYGGNTSGADIGAHYLDSVTKPGMLAWGTTDSFVGYRTPGAGSQFPGGGNLPDSLMETLYVTAVGAGSPLIAHASTTQHDMPTAEVTPNSAPPTTTASGGGAALSTLGSLSVGSVTGLVSGLTTVVASDGVPHVVVFTGTSGGNTLTGCSYSGLQTATVANGAVVSGTPTYLYWFTSTVDPIAPKAY